MCQIRYSVALLEERWIVRRDCRRLGDFGDLESASTAAEAAAAIDRVRGHSVEILRLDEDGRWESIGLTARRRAPVT